MTSNDLSLTATDIDNSLTAIQEAFRQVRPTILDQAGKATYTNKADGSPVTDTDVAVEKTLFAILKDRLAGVPVFGEESGYGSDLPDVFWLLDPIDGTKSFIANTPGFTNMAVLIQNKEAVASVIYDIPQDDMYVARKDRGAYKNNVRLDLSTVPLPHTAFCRPTLAKAVAELLQAKDLVLEASPGGGGYEFAAVADGQSAARFSLQSRGYTHDYAPGALLVREAGGVLIPIQDDMYTYKTRSFVACHPALEPVVRPRVQALRDLENRAGRPQ